MDYLSEFMPHPCCDPVLKFYAIESGTRKPEQRANKVSVIWLQSSTSNTTE